MFTMKPLRFGTMILAISLMSPKCEFFISGNHGKKHKRGAHCFVLFVLISYVFQEIVVKVRYWNRNVDRLKNAAYRGPVGRRRWLFPRSSSLPETIKDAS